MSAEEWISHCRTSTLWLFVVIMKIISDGWISNLAFCICFRSLMNEWQDANASHVSYKEIIHSLCIARHCQFLYACENTRNCFCCDIVSVSNEDFPLCSKDIQFNKYPVNYCLLHKRLYWTNWQKMILKWKKIEI